MMNQSDKHFESDMTNSLTNTATVGDFQQTNPSFRNPIPSDTSNSAAGPPILPPRPEVALQPNYGLNPYGGMAGSYGMGVGSYGMGAGSYGMGAGSYGMGGYGYGNGYGGYGIGSPYGGMNRFGPMHGDIESRFIQLAEESSRPAFDSIHSVVNAVGSVAMMLENTFFALTSSFRAILGVAENFGRLRSLFAQFWSTFAVVRSINWLIRKLLVLLGIRTENEFKAWAAAVAASQPGVAAIEPHSKTSGWPILLFFAVITAAPYLVLRMFTRLSSSINEKLNDPASWQNPLRALAQHDFQATSPQEISFSANQVLTLAPQYLQGHLWNSGWLMASTDKQFAGLVPVNYIKIIRPPQEGVAGNSKENTTKKAVEPKVEDLEKFYQQDL